MGDREVGAPSGEGEGAPVLGAKVDFSPSPGGASGALGQGAGTMALEEENW